jgi:chromosome segregation ATPase
MFETTASTVIIAGIGLLVLSYAIIMVAKHKTLDHPEFYNVLPTIGFIGTLIGIIIGLMNFDVNAIESSIPELLGGLKTAFITSLGALGLLVLTKIYYRIRFKKQKGDKVKNETDPIRYQLERHEMILERIAKNIAGDDDGSLLTQMKTFRTDMKDSINELCNHQIGMKQAFEDFANKMAENNYNALIMALREVIADFNAKINEQFGDNFKQLNKAVENLLVWQNNYKDHINSMQEQFVTTLRVINESKEALDIIGNNNQQLLETSSNLNILSKELNKKLLFFNEGLEKFSSTAERAGKSFDVIEENIKNITEGVKTTTKDFILSSRKAIDISLKGLEHHQKNMNDISNRFENSSSKLIISAEESIDKTMKGIETHQQKIFEINNGFQANLLARTEDAIEKTQKGFDSHQESILKINKGFEATSMKLLSSTEEAVNKTMKGLDSHQDRILEINNSFDISAKKFLENSEKAVENTINGWKDHQTEIKRTQVELNKSIKSTLSEGQGLIRSVVEENAKSITKQIEVLDKQLGDKLNKALNTLGSSLATLSNKFVTDYSPLTDKLTNLISMVSKVKNGNARI